LTKFAKIGHSLSHKGSSQFPDDKERDGPQNVSLLAIQPPDAASSLKIFY